MAYSFRATDVEDFDFDDLQVPPSLDLALRYLRSGTASRTLWIDALCINQKDEAEKRIQNQRMQASYANAWRVVVWLGGYHVITAENSACSEADYCSQRRQIEKAFYVCTGLSSWRFVYSWLFNLDRVFAEQAVAGLIDIDKRGWWERLWAIQEMALATGRVLLQCGKSVCHYNLYCAMRLKMIERFDNMTDLQRTSAAAMQTFVETTELFRYPEDLLPTGSLIRLWLVQLISRAAGQERRQQFRKQKLTLRLQYILLRTSGHFKCRDVQDRLYGVLGIAGGSIVGTKNRALRTSY